MSALRPSSARTPPSARGYRARVGDSSQRFPRRAVEDDGAHAEVKHDDERRSGVERAPHRLTAALDVAGDVNRGVPARIGVGDPDQRPAEGEQRKGRRIDRGRCADCISDMRRAEKDKGENGGDFYRDRAVQETQARRRRAGVQRGEQDDECARDQGAPVSNPPTREA